MFALLTLVGWMSGSGSRDSGISTTSICFRVLHIFLKSSILAASSLIGVPEDSKKRWEARRSRFRAVIACLGTLCPAFEADVDCYQRVYVDKKTSLRTFPFKAKSSKNCLVSCSLFLLCRLHSSDSTGIVYPILWNCSGIYLQFCRWTGKQSVFEFRWKIYVLISFCRVIVSGFFLTSKAHCSIATSLPISAKATGPNMDDYIS